MRLRLERRSSPIGTMLLVGDEAGALRALDFEDHEPRLHRLLGRHYPGHALAEGPAPAGRALDAYFEGDLTALAGILVATGGTAFQREVWAALREKQAF